MKTCVKNLLLLSVLMAGLGVMLAGRATAQTFTTLHTFTPGDGTTNSDGAYPVGSLILSGDTLYGTTANQGISSGGTVFAINTDGTGFTTLYSFGWTIYSFTNSDGAGPVGPLVLSGDTLYGIASAYGPFGSGTVFAINTDGTGFRVLYTFTATPPYPGPYTNSDGAVPQAGLILSGNTLYGTAYQGGSSGNGTVFALNTNGTGFTVLHTFAAIQGPPFFPGTNSDGANPYAGLIISGNTLYGTAASGGSSGNGTVFAINTDGTGFTNLHSFTHGLFDGDGANPKAGLILSGKTLYGTAYGGGSFGYFGTVFAVNTDGTGFTNLHSFTGTILGTNSDGAYPYAGLLLSGNTLYGTALQGGSFGNGTVFALNTNGTGFTVLHAFTTYGNYGNSNSDGANPYAPLILSGNTLYGTANYAGSFGNGTVFSLSFAPQLTITPSGTNVVLTWPTNDAGFDYTGYILQSATNLEPPALWTTNSPPPIVVNGQNTVTNPITGSQQFFRLIQ